MGLRAGERVEEAGNAAGATVSLSTSRPLAARNVTRLAVRSRGAKAGG